MTIEVWATIKDTTLGKASNKLFPSDDSTTAPEEPPNTEFESE